MKDNFQITSRFVLEDIGPDVGSCIVQVKDPDNPWIEVRFRIRDTRDVDPDIVYFRIAEMRIIPADVVGSKPSELLQDAVWWHELLDSVLLHVAFNSTACDRAAEKADEKGDFIFLYAWDGGEVHEAQMNSA